MILLKGNIAGARRVKRSFRFTEILIYSSRAKQNYGHIAAKRSF